MNWIVGCSAIVGGVARIAFLSSDEYQHRRISSIYQYNFKNTKHCKKQYLNRASADCAHPLAEGVRTPVVSVAFGKFVDEVRDFRIGRANRRMNRVDRFRQS
ncbi:MAG: hypothetical protein ACFCUG_02900, partial [Thiotrichales bacterium]